MAERRTVNVLVVGSNPTEGAYIRDNKSMRGSILSKYMVAIKRDFLYTHNQEAILYEVTSSGYMIPVSEGSYANLEALAQKLNDFEVSNADKIKGDDIDLNNVALVIPR